MAELFAEFPFLSNDKVVIRKMEEADIPALAEISRNDNADHVNHRHSHPDRQRFFIFIHHNVPLFSK